MAEFDFDVPPSMAGWLKRCRWADAHLCGIEGVPLATRVRLDGNRLTLARGNPTSAKLVFPAIIDGVGTRTLTTASLRPTRGGGDSAERPPYSLPLELARGAVDSLRRHAFDARTVADAAGGTAGEAAREVAAREVAAPGDAAPGDATPTAREPGDAPECRFVEAQVAWGGGDHHAAGVAAMDAVSGCHRILERVTRRRWTEAINSGVAAGRPLGTLVAASLTPPRDADGVDWPAVASAFNAVSLRTTWSDLETDSGRLDFDALDRCVEAATRQGLRIIAGPLLDFRVKRLPHWLYLLEDDFDSLVRVAVRMASSVVGRYAGRVQLWNVASALNLPGPLPLSEEQTMALSVELLQAVRRADPSAATVMSFDCPMGEYLASTNRGISPIHFADAVLRSGLGLSGLGLEIRTGFDAPSTQPRGAWEFGGLIDRWSMLGVPLMITAAVPAATGVDHTAVSDRSVAAEEPEASPSKQLTAGGSLLAASLARPSVHGFVWDGFDDRLPHTVPHAGLIDAEGQRRSLLDVFQRLRGGVI